MNKYRHLLLSALLFCLPWMAQAQESTYFLHTITKGQSLYSIAAMYGVTTNEIISLNPGSEQVIKAGAKLRIPQKQADKQVQRFHTIQPGETLYRLTQVYGVTAQQLINANPGLTAQNFKAGQVIVIPPKATGEISMVTATTASKQQITPASTSVQTDESLSSKQNKYMDMHRVKRKETIYSICKKYGITRTELLNANPEIKSDKLKKGTYLRIPYPKNHKDAPKTENKPLVQPTDKELFEQLQKQTVAMDMVKVAVILPFMLDESVSNEQRKMVEYYEGFLMAVDSLKSEGYSFEIFTYDSKGSSASIKDILAKKEMKEMNLIIGPVYASHIKEASRFAEKHHIRMIVPFSSKDDEVFNNPYIYQINTPQSYLYSEVYEHFTRLFRNDMNIIFVDTQDDSKDKAEFINGLKTELDAHQIGYKQFTAQIGDTIAIQEVVTTEKENLFIPMSGKSLALIRLLPQLKFLSMNYPEYSLHMFGYPEWQTYTNDYISDFYTMDTYFYGSFYTNNLAVATANFQHAFRNWYGKAIIGTYPKYAILGFDTGYYFLKGLALYGNNLENNLANIKVNPIQTSFKFERVNNWGGFINKKVFFVHFTKNYELLKMDFDK